MANKVVTAGAGLAPIILLGSGRSGTTILFRLLLGHSHCAYVTNLTDILPGMPQLAALSRVSALHRFSAFRPSFEAIRAFEYCGISDDQLLREKRTFSEVDVTLREKESLRELVAAHARWQGKPRFINKNTSNTMRVRYLLDIFPDARFVHIIRHGFGVVNSLINVQWWNDLNLWWLGQTPRQWQAEGGNPHELAALHWKRQVEDALRDTQHVPASQYFECRYEDLLNDPQPLLRNILDFCELPWDDDFERHFNAIRISKGSLDKWRSSFDDEAISAIVRASGDLLASLGYETPSPVR